METIITLVSFVAVVVAIVVALVERDKASQYRRENLILIDELKKWAKHNEQMGREIRWLRKSREWLLTDQRSDEPQREPRT